MLQQQKHHYLLLICKELKGNTASDQFNGSNTEQLKCKHPEAWVHRDWGMRDGGVEDNNMHV